MCACLPLFPAIINSTALQLHLSADWFKLTLRSIRDRLLSSRSHNWSNPGDPSASNQFYRESVYVTQDANGQTQRKAAEPSYSSIELPLRDGSSNAAETHGIGNKTKIEAHDESYEVRVPAVVEVRRGYRIEREFSSGRRDIEAPY